MLALLLWYSHDGKLADLFLNFVQTGPGPSSLPGQADAVVEVQQFTYALVEVRFIAKRLSLCVERCRENRRGSVFLTLRTFNGAK